MESDTRLPVTTEVMQSNNAGAQRKNANRTTPTTRPLWAPPLSLSGSAPGVTHGFVSDQVVLDGGASVILLHPVHLEGVTLLLHLGLQLGCTGFPWADHNRGNRR